MAGVRKTGTTGNNSLVGGTGDDTLDGLAGNDTLVGNSGADLLIGGDGYDSLLGGDGNDTLNGGAGADTLKGGLGNDTYVVGSGDVLSESSTGGVDTVESSISWTLGSNFENLTLIGTSGASATGNSLNNIITGNSGNNSIAGREGNDTMSGGAGNDRFNMSNGAAGSYGTDSIDGGIGIDTLNYGGYALTAVFVDLAAGTASGGATAGAGSAKLASIENVVGGSFNDVITGDSVANSLSGGAGNDTLDGRAGADRLEGGTGADRYVFSVAPGTANADSLVGFVSGTDRVVLDGNVHAKVGASGSFSSGDARFFSGAFSATDVISGQDPSDRVIYNKSNGDLYYDADGSGAGLAVRIATLQGAPVLAATDIAVINGSTTGDGGTGSGAVNGTPGNDNLIGGTGDDTLDGLAGNDNVHGNAGADLLMGGAGDDTVLGGDGADLLRGGDGNDILADHGYYFSHPGGYEYYGFGPDKDADRMEGGAGSDTYVVGGRDVLYESVDSPGIDTVVLTDPYQSVDGVAEWTLGDGFENLDMSSASSVEYWNPGATGIGNSLDNYIVGSPGNDVIIGGDGNDTLVGNGAGSGLPDELYGGMGNDTLASISGVNRLTGGSGADNFEFSVVEGGTFIADFAPSLDSLFLYGVYLGASGKFSAEDGRFWAASYAASDAVSGHDADDRVVYDLSSGNLYYDADGSGAGAAQLIATLNGAPTVAATDIIVI